MGKVSNSSTVRVHRNTDFTIMSNHHLRNTELSLKAIGLMSKILGLPDDWDYSIAGLVKICKEQETAVRAALSELEKSHYVYIEKRMPNQTASKRIEYVYHIYEIPYEAYEDTNIPLNLVQNGDIQPKEKQEPENLPLENLTVENQGQLNTYQSNTKKSNMKNNITADSVSDKKSAKNASGRKKQDNKKSYAEAVRMTEEEYQKLTANHTIAFVDKCIEILNNYKLSSGKRYQSDYHAILNWVIERVSKDYPQLDKHDSSQDYDINVNPFDQFL